MKATGFCPVLDTSLCTDGLGPQARHFPACIVLLNEVKFQIHLGPYSKSQMTASSIGLV